MNGVVGMPEWVNINKNKIKIITPNNSLACRQKNYSERGICQFVKVLIPNRIQNHTPSQTLTVRLTGHIK